MERAKPWHEDDFFWETWGPIMFTQKRLEEAVTHVEQIIPLLGIKPPMRILDLGCGVGRHSLELARREFLVTGVDRTERYLKQASEKAKKQKLKVEFIQDDMRNFCRPDTFDAAINMFTSFTYFEDPEEDRQVVLNVYQSLKLGGVFLLHTHGKEILARIFQERSWEERNGILVLEERNISRNWGWIERRVIIIKDDKRTEFNVTHRLYSATEMATLFSSVGFKYVDVYGDFDGGSYDQTAKTLVVVGHK